MNTEAVALSPTEKKPRPELFIIVIPLLIAVFSTIGIQAASTNHGVYFPLILTPSIASTYLPRIGFFMLAGIGICIVAYQRRSHSLTVFATLLTTAIVYGETLAQWVAPPSETLDLRIAATVFLAYVPQTLAFVALGTHALIEAAATGSDASRLSPQAGPSSMP
jgi:hypothetical protein